jgi:hypothetical protein
VQQHRLRPLIDALELLRRYAHREGVTFYDLAERVPLDGVLRADWRGRSWMSAGGRSGFRIRRVWRARKQQPACATRVARAKALQRLNDEADGRATGEGQPLPSADPPDAGA